MGKHLSKYQSEADYNNNKDNHVKPHISYIVNPVKRMIYIKKYVSYTDEYFTIRALRDGNMTLNIPLSYTTAPSYSVNEGDWITFTSNKTLSLKFDDKVRVKCVTDAYSRENISMFSNSCEYEVYGNIMSLLYGDNFKGQTNLTGKDYAFYGLFYDVYDALKGAENLILPATTLATGCYMSMFQGCNSLTSAPQLQATALASSCYEYMFQSCTSLTITPELPATTLANNCYSSMFRNCLSLTTAPELPATTLANNCYSSMFRNCLSLTTAPELPATILASSCYWYMFESCESLTTAPELPATILAEYCYYNMFAYCSNLNKITMLATNISASGCLTEWVYGVASSGTFIKHKNMTSLRNSDSGIPKGWVVEDYVETNLITFYIHGKQCQAEEGMTWADWYISDMNNEISEIFNPPKDHIYNSLDYVIIGGAGWQLLYNNVYVKFGDYIQKEVNYQFDISSGDY